MIKQKIAIVHPCFRVGGGSEAMPLWMIETLKRKYDFTLITMGQINLDELNKAYGTDLKKGNLKLFQSPSLFFSGNGLTHSGVTGLHDTARNMLQNMT